MKKYLILILTLICAGRAHGQAVLPNVNYSGNLTSTCSTPNAACAGAVFVTNFGTGGQAGSAGNGSALDIPVTNYAAATITVSGTYAGVTINFDFSDPTGGTNYFQEVCARTDINVLEASEVLPTNQIRAWQCPVWAATRFRVRASAFTSGSAIINITLTQAAIDPSLIVAAAPPVVPGSTDPCQDLSQQKSSVAVNISTATTTQIVALSGTTAVYVCGYSLVAGAGTNPSIQFEYGTGASCGTGTTALTGAMATGVTVSTTAPGPIFNSPGQDVSLLKTAAGNALCLVSGGTTPNFQGFVTFVQQ